MEGNHEEPIGWATGQDTRGSDVEWFVCLFVGLV